MTNQTICLIGGTGFVGRHLAAELTRRGYSIRVLTRHRERCRSLLVFPNLDLVETDIHDPVALSGGMEGCPTVVNLAGILNEVRTHDANFAAVHTELPTKIVTACREQGVGRLVHMSALNAGADAPSEYLRSKAMGEDAVLAAAEDIAVTTFRPSVIFGHDDNFFNRFSALLRLTPFVMPLACSETNFAPVHVEDVVTAFADALHDKRTFGQSYELCGPHQYTLKELVEYTASVCGLNRRVLPMSARLSLLQARMLEFIPGKPFSIDNYRSLQVDCVCSNNGFASLKIDPVCLESVVPRYLGQADRNRRYQIMRTHARRQ